MSKNEILKYISVGVGLGGLFLILNKWLGKQREVELLSGQSKLSLETARKIMHQIKYQMLISCLTISTNFNNKFKKLTPAQLKLISKNLKESILKIYQQRESIILDKYEITKQVFAQALKFFEEDKEVSKIKKAIFEIMKQAFQGNIPDLSVPEQAFKLLSEQQLIKCYRELSELIIFKIWNIVNDLVSNDPTFNLKDETHFKRVLRMLNVYDVKVVFLKEKGFIYQWGCPNEVFIKVIAAYKNRNTSFKDTIMTIQKAQQQLVQKVSHNPQELDEMAIHQFYNKMLRE